MKIVFHPRFHQVYTYDPASEAGRMEAVVSELDGLEFVEPEEANEEDILLVHSEAHLEDVRGMEKIYGTAMLSVGAAIKAARISFEEPAFAALRPPGHHASPKSCWGFCFFNNIAIAASRLLEDGMVDKAVIVDFDLHYGDGTANIFRDDERVGYYHLPGDNVDSISHFLSKNEYDIIAVSAGFDRHKKDWGGILETEDYTRIGEIIKEHAEEKCEGRRFGVLEGGYNHQVLGRNVRAFVDGFE
ncbi:MAG: histone deacetylase family protein [Archaeoglobaceae archaeon]